MKFFPENGVKTDSKKAQANRKSQEILDLGGCLKRAASLKKQAPSVKTSSVCKEKNWPHM